MNIRFNLKFLTIGCLNFIECQLSVSLKNYFAASQFLAWHAIFRWDCNHPRLPSQLGVLLANRKRWQSNENIIITASTARRAKDPPQHRRPRLLPSVLFRGYRPTPRPRRNRPLRREGAPRVLVPSHAIRNRGRSAARATCSVLFGGERRAGIRRAGRWTAQAVRSGGTGEDLGRRGRGVRWR